MKWKPTLLFGGLIALGACGSDSTTLGPALPSEHGRWSVDEAMRSGRKTNTLDAAFFSFDTVTHEIETNFTGEPLKLDYTYKNGVINLRGSALLDSFIISESSDSTLHLSTVIKGTPFSFKLKPSVLPSDKVQLGESEVPLTESEE